MHSQPKEPHRTAGSVVLVSLPTWRACSSLFALASIGAPLPLLCGATAGEESARFDQFQVKAAYLYNFVRYVEWPPTRFSSPESPLVIGVSSASPLLPELQRMIAGHQINGRALLVRVCENVEQARTTHLLFVQSSDQPWLVDELPSLQRAGILTVGESDLFAARGGIFVFVADGDRLRFKINLTEAQRAGLKVSSQLLKLALSVSGKPR